MDADLAFRRFFNHNAGFPKFKKKGKSDPKMYLVKTDIKTVIRCERHKDYDPDDRMDKTQGKDIYSK